MELRERAIDLETITAAAAAARGGDGAVVVIEGEAGIGKTALMQHAIAATTGFAVHRARGREQAREGAFGIARQLAGGAPVTAAVDEPVVAHALALAVADAAEQQPQLLALDDAQWADAASLRWLAQLAEQAPALPLLVLATVRSGEPAPEALATLRARALGVRPERLSRDGTAAVVRGRLGPDAAPAFCAACHRLSAGNPLALGELLRTVAADGLAPTDANAAAVDGLGARGLAGPLLDRVARLGPAATAVARAVAVLEPHASSAAVAELTGHDAGAVAAAAAALVRAGVLADRTPLRFAHPLLLDAVAADVPEPERDALRARAAAVLHARGAPPDVVARHLLATTAATGPWVVTALREAAARATSSADPASAVAHLRRALAEPLPPDERRALRHRIGDVMLRAGDPAGIDELLGLRDELTDPALRAQLALDCTVSLAIRDRTDEVIALLAASRAELGDAPEGAELLLAVSPPVIALYGDVPGLRAALPGVLATARASSSDTTPGRLARQAAAYWTAPAGICTVPETAALARAAIGTPEAVARTGREGFPMYPAILTLVACGEADAALEALAVAITGPRERGALYGIVFGLLVGVTARLAQGDLARAEEESQEALRLVGSLGIRSMHSSVAAVACAVARERADHATVAGFTAPRTQAQSDLILRAELALARGDAAELRALAAARDGIGATTASMLPVRFPAAALARDVASAEANLAFARASEHPRWIGVAQWALGVAADDPGPLRDAVATLAATDARLDHARALLDLGATLRRQRDRAAAREPLAAALDLAQRLTAAALAERAREELLAAGARPRRAVLSGAESLTASERRVARLAAEGLTNREIAQTLFVTRKTVESHLGRVYRKLDTSDRTQLAARLGA